MMGPKKGEMLLLAEDSAAPDGEKIDSSGIKRPPMQIVWYNVLFMAILHLVALYAICIVHTTHPLTWLFTFALYVMSAMGITAGAHRLWSHRAYKAKLPLRILLAIFNSMAAQNDIIEWARDHRVHHKYSETDADPHNATRGFFFAHIGWLLVRKHPDVKTKGKQLDLSDLLADPVCAMQRKFYMPSVYLVSVIIPTVLPWYLWGETLWNAYLVCGVLRYIAVLNATWGVNSWAHLYGNKPYDQNINPTENLLVSLSAIGEGYHNYHHTFPFDYKTSEYGWRVNFTTLFLDLMAGIGQVYDRRKMSPESVSRRRQRTGDGSEGFGFMKSMTGKSE